MDYTIAIPPELEMIALRMFDNLVAKGEILYEPLRTSINWVQGFQVLKTNRSTADTNTDANRALVN